MPRAFTITMQQAVLNYFFGNTAHGITLTTLYVGLIQTMPNPDGSQTYTEVTGNEYARVAVPAANWNTATSAVPSVKTNSVAVLFPAPTTGSWSAALGYGIWTASTAGTLLAAELFAQSVQVNMGSQAPSFASGQFQITLD